VLLFTVVVQAALEIILNEFENIDKEDFDKLEASLMGEIFRARTKYFIQYERKKTALVNKKN